jgi:hypothetical protein
MVVVKAQDVVALQDEAQGEVDALRARVRFGSNLTRRVYHASYLIWRAIAEE